MLLLAVNANRANPTPLHLVIGVYLAIIILLLDRPSVERKIPSFFRKNAKFRLF
jgi:hypothetical protein